MTELNVTGETKEARTKSKHLLFVLIPLFVSISLALFRIHVSEPHADAGAVLKVFEPKWSQFLSDFFNPQGIYGGAYPPLYHVIAKAYGTVFGTSIVNLRLLSVIGLAALVFLSWFSYPLLTQSQDRRLRFWFSLAVGMSPAHIWWAQTAKYTMWLYLMYAVSMIAALWFLQNRSIRSTVISSLSVCAVIYTHYVGLIFAAAHFCTLGLIAVGRRDHILVRRLILSAVLVTALTAPILLTVYQAERQHRREGYFVKYEKRFSLLDITRGIVTEWNFGYSLVPNHKTMTSISSLAESIKEWDSAQAFSALRHIALPLCAALVLCVGIVHATVQVLKSNSSRVNAAYVVGVPLFTLLLSLTKGMASRFVYLGFGTWCTLAFLTIGWSGSKRLRVPLSLGMIILLLYAASLRIYYQRLDCKYPGASLVMEYLKRRESDFKIALVDDWIVRHRGTPLDQNQLASNISVHIVASASSIPLELLRKTQSIAFLAGPLESVQSSLASMKADHPNFSWDLIKSWESLEMPGRSIHVYRLNYEPQEVGREADGKTRLVKRLISQAVK